MPFLAPARRSLTAFLIASMAGMISHARAEEPEKPGEKERVDTEFIFGFTAGADVGELGERELEHQTTAQWDKRDGRYVAGGDQLRFETSPVQDFRFEVGVPVAYYNISGVTGLDDRNQGAVNGVTTEFRYRLFNRDNAPFSLTLSAEPHWSRTEEVTGERVNNYGGELTLVLDKELAKNRVFGALNLVYDPETTQSRITGLWEQESTLGFSAAITTQISLGLFVGAEARHLRKYGGIGLDTLLGQAFFRPALDVCPTVEVSGDLRRLGHSGRGPRERSAGRARSDEFHPAAGDPPPRIQFLNRHRPKAPLASITC